MELPYAGIFETLMGGIIRNLQSAHAMATLIAADEADASTFEAYQDAIGWATAHAAKAVILRPLKTTLWDDTMEAMGITSTLGQLAPVAAAADAAQVALKSYLEGQGFTINVTDTERRPLAGYSAALTAYAVGKSAPVQSAVVNLLAPETVKTIKLVRQETFGSPPVTELTALLNAIPADVLDVAYAAQE